LALQDPKVHWQIGKSAAVIMFVKEAQDALLERTDLTDTERQRLTTTVQQLKNGTASIDKHETIDEWLERTFINVLPGFGASPPPGAGWQIGKTAATIRFVNEAEVEMYHRPDMTNGEAFHLLKLVDRLKSGAESMTAFETVDEWLQRLRNRHP
jgi:hypothetical protein